MATYQFVTWPFSSDVLYRPQELVYVYVLLYQGRKNLKGRVLAVSFYDFKLCYF